MSNDFYYFWITNSHPHSTCPPHTLLFHTCRGTPSEQRLPLLLDHGFVSHSERCRQPSTLRGALARGPHCRSTTHLKRALDSSVVGLDGLHCPPGTLRGAFARGPHRRSAAHLRMAARGAATVSQWRWEPGPLLLPAEHPLKCSRLQPLSPQHHASEDGSERQCGGLGQHVLPAGCLMRCCRSQPRSPQHYASAEESVQKQY